MNWKIYLISLTGILSSIFIILSLIPAGEITGLFVFEDVAPKGFEFVPPKNVSEQIAHQALQEAETEIVEMKQENLTIIFVNDIIHEANLQYQQGNYTEALKMTELITFVHEKKREFLDRVELLKRKAQELQKQQVNTSNGEVIAAQALDAFYRDQLVDAEGLLQQADKALDEAQAEKQRQKSLVYLGRNFILKYWWQILLVFVIIGIISPPVVKQIIKKKRQTKLALLKTELEKTKELIKQLQKECFVNKTISLKAYKTKATQYEERMVEIRHTIPVLEAQIQNKKIPLPKSKVPGGLEIKR